MPHIFVAGLFHETHTFLDQATPLADFAIRCGEELLDCVGDSSPMGGALEAFRSWNWNLTLGPDYRAVPSGIVEDQVVEAFWTEFERRWTPHVDAIFLVLHGAMVSQSILDVEGEILRRIGTLAGAAEKPVFGVYDLHANFSHAMAMNSSALIAYRCNPHSDAKEASCRAAELLRRQLETGQSPRIAHRPARRIWPPTATGTADDPMRTLAAMARDLEQQRESIWAVNVTGGFAFADTPDTGVSFQIVSTDLQNDAILLERLIACAEKLDSLSSPREQSIEEVMIKITGKPAGGLTVLVEPSDNIGGGAPGDTTGLLRALIDHELENAAICINDPAAVGMLFNQPPGTSLPVSIGGKGSRFDLGPLDLPVELVSTSDGNFSLADKRSHLASMSGDSYQMGRCAVVRHKGLQILLTSRKTPPFDLGQWYSQGIDPARLNTIVVKAAVAHRQAYDPITRRTFTVDTPGPCRSDLSQFHYVHALAPRR